MAHEPIPVEILEIALARAGGDDFERFAQAFLSALEGVDFVPVGGMHDGGADGFRRLEICESGRPGIFHQFTEQENHRRKIRETVKMLRKVGRAIRDPIFASDSGRGLATAFPR